MTDTELVELSDSLLLFEDTCNAYALLDGDAALVVDPGSGEVLEALGEAGVEVEWALHTHHHRDQCWGTHRLVEAGADVAVPEYERYLFEDVETFWESKRVYDNYNDRSTFYTLAESVPVAATLEDYSVFEWRGYEFEVVPAKGHTFGSSALFAEVDGREVGFTGDLIHAGGHLQTLHDMEYTYGDVKGVPLTLESLSAVESRSPDALLPSHGPPIDDPDGDIEALRDRLMDLVDLGMVESGARAYLPEMEMEQLSSHLLWGGPWTCSNFYVVVSESGKALFIDYGLSMHHHQHIGQDREDLETTRFVEHHLDELSEYGVTEFDVVVPTHIHDDHTCGIPHLQDHYDTECWALDDVAKVIEDPAAWSSTPCTFDKPVDVDRQFADGESFTWEEYEFDVYHAPGQTEFHSVVAVDVDGETVAFSGDNYFERERTTPADVYLNRREERPM
jgi:glyoxylase-like metal-dependent hydrolase (beta-lactamase superfamily II)